MNELVLLFLSVAAAEFFAEMGDKTQLMLVGLSSKYKFKDIITGTFLAILVLNAIAVFAGSFVSSLIPLWLVKFIAGALFIFFAIISIVKKEDDEEENSNSKIKLAPLAVFCTFFIAEFGDKTQFTALTFGANYGLSKALVVWAACSAGLFLADILGMLAGLCLSKKLPENFLKCISFVLFMLFGSLSIYEGIKLINPSLNC